MGHTIDQSYEEGIRAGIAEGLIVIEDLTNAWKEVFRSSEHLSPFNTRPLHIIGRRLLELALRSREQAHLLICGAGAGCEVFDALRIDTRLRVSAIGLTPYNPYLDCAEQFFPNDPDRLLELQRLGGKTSFRPVPAEATSRARQYIGSMPVLMRSHAFAADVAYDSLGSFYYELEYRDPEDASVRLHAWLQRAIRPDGCLFFAYCPFRDHEPVTVLNHALIMCESTRQALVLGPKSKLRDVFGMPPGTTRNLVLPAVEDMKQALGITPEDEIAHFEENDALFSADPHVLHVF